MTFLLCARASLPVILTRMSEGAHRLRGVEVFAAGEHRGKRYTTSDLDDMADGFRRFSTGPKARLRVPAVLGHGEDQKLLEASDLPAAGWPDRVYRKGGKLLADFDDLPPAVARLLKGRAYRTVSAEVYDEIPDGLPGAGRPKKTLRRIAFLGGDIPQIKSLAEIPVPEPYHERPFASAGPAVLSFRGVSRRPLPSGAYAVFAEVTPDMDRDSTIQKLTEHGLDAETLKDVPDDALADMLRVCEDKDSAKDDPDEFDEDEEVPPPADEGAKESYREKHRRYAEMARKYGDRVKKYAAYADDDQPPTDLPPEATGGVRMPTKVQTTEHYREQVRKVIREELKRSAGSLGELRKFAEQTRAAEKKRSVDSVIDRLGREGRLPPAQRDAVARRLMRADATQVVEKFSEKGKTVELTEFDSQVRELERQPSLFGECFRDPAALKGSEDDEVRKVEQHYETFSESFQKVGTTRDEMVKAFKARRKQDPKLSAEGFLGKV